jgi:zinc protease
MVSNPLFKNEDLIPECEVVFEEYRRSVDSASQFNFFNLQKNSFPKFYSHPILGTEKNIKNFTLEQLNLFRNTYYNCENALFVVAGNIGDRDKLLKKINEYKLPHGKVSHFPKFQLKKDSRINIHKKPVNQAMLTLNIQAPEYSDLDSSAEDLALNCLAYGDISPLYNDFVTNNSIASSIGGSTMFFSRGGCHFLKIAFPVENLSKVFNQLPKTLARVFKDGFELDDIERIRNQYIASKVYEKESIESFAFALGHGFAQTGDINCEDEFIKKMKSLSKRKVLTSLVEIFSRTIHATLQLPNEVEGQKLDAKVSELITKINSTSTNQKNKKSNLKITESKFDTEAKMITLKKGIKLVYRYNPLTPTFVLHTYIKGGLSYEDSSSNGTFNLIAKNLTYGYKGTNYPELKNDLDKKSSYINGFSGRNAYGLTLHGLSEFSDSLIAHYMNILLNPTFPNSYFKLEKELIKRALFLQKEDPVKFCFSNFNDLVFNKHPYSLDIIGTDKSVSKINRKQVLDTHQKSLNEQELVITYCGDLDLDTVLEKISPYTAQLKPRTKINQIQKNKISPIKNKKIQIDFDREQVHVMIGKPAYTVKKVEDLYLKIFTTFLAGQSSELFLEVRDRKGLCYSVQPLQNTSLEAGYWGIYIGAGHDKKGQAIDAIKEILNKYQKNGMSKTDFVTVKKMIQGQNLINIQTNEDYANFYSIAALHNLGFDYQHDSFKLIDEIKHEDFNKFLSKFLVDDWNLVEVGRMS